MFEFDSTPVKSPDHTIDKDTIVEVRLKNGCRSGIRLYVTGHTYDQHGNPTYALSFDKHAYSKWMEVQQKLRELTLDSAGGEAAYNIERRLLLAKAALFVGSMILLVSPANIIVING